MHISLLSTPALFAASIAMILMVSLLVLASGLYQRSQQAYLTFFFLCLVISLYQWFTFEYHQLQSQESAIYWLKLQTACYIAILPAAFYCFAVWTRQQHTKLWLKLLLGWSLALAILNFVLPYGLKLSHVERVVTWPGDAGYMLQNFIGPLHWAGILLHLTGLILILWLLWRCWILVTRGKKIMAIGISIFVLLLMLTWGIAAGIQTGQVNSVQLVGFTFNYFLILVCIDVAVQLHRQREKLQHALTTSERVAGALQGLMRGAGHQVGSRFYANQVKQLKRLYQADICFIGQFETSPEGIKQVRVLAIHKDGQAAENFTYTLGNSPCQGVGQKDVCTYHQDVQQQFPDDAMLTQEHIQAYLGMPVRDVQGKPIGLIVLLFRQAVEPIQEFEQTLLLFAERTASEMQREQAEQKLKQAAYTDNLTHLPNRKALWDWLSAQPDNHWQGYPTFQFLLIDIDGFKEINKLHGQAIGDQVLQAVAQRLQAYAKTEDLVVRYASNSFVFIKQSISTADEPMIKLNGETIASLIRTPIELAGRQLKLAASIGSALACQAKNQEELLHFAESALKQAKEGGQGKIRRFDPALQSMLDDRALLEKELADSIKKGEFFLLFQPQTTPDGELRGAEVLIRWAHPVKGMIRPDLFISVAEETGLIRLLGQWLFEAVFRQIQTWRRERVHYPKHLAINVSPLQFVDPAFVENLQKLMLYYDISPAEIVIELVETGLLNDKDETMQKLHKLRDLGFKLALDDFGTGYSSLSYLKDLPLDILKIDKSFVDDLNTPSTQKLVSAIVDICHHLSLEVVCEGVEQQWQVERLRNMGCQRFQGYYFARPLTPEKLIQWQFSEAVPQQ
ncbi:putative bifunctional diguanylate cyclase/phosphodiesterase [Bowmanella pacifica]|uniref:Diguanylate cyclase (GGDEF) domain-containing protein n=1 Tax=Bowmanella pacifica TaxID=502051 RepID=A0A917YVW2_9ALTE|nr:EAL domain-containing protein [Bowmanella pacifica]GGO68002.1 hypothetical protein GCM10010982_15900 [Bowmanella pacifica]